MITTSIISKTFKRLPLFVLILTICIDGLTQSLAVVNRDKNELTIISLQNGQILHRLQTGDQPHEVTVSDDGKLLAVGNYGAQIPGSSVYLYEVKSMKCINKIDLGNYIRPHGMKFIDKRTLAVTAEIDKAVILIDVISGDVTSIHKTEQLGSHMLAYDKKRQYIYTANILSGSVSKISLDGEKVETFSVTKGIEGIDFSSSMNEIWVANRKENKLYGISHKGEIRHKLNTGFLPFRVLVSDRNGAVFTSNAQSNTISAFSTNSGDLISTINITQEGILNAAPGSMTLDSNEQFLYVSCMGAGMIARIDLQTFKVDEFYEAGKTPDGIIYFD